MSYDGFEVPDAIEPVVGYRGWLVRDGKLISCYRAVTWPVNGPLVSSCLMPTNRIKGDQFPKRPPPAPHAVPIKDCTCGVYALHEFPSVWEVREGERRLTFKPWPQEAVVGVVEGWGHIVMGTKGFRAEIARPVALVSRRRSKQWAPVIEELAYNYGIDIVDARELRLDGYIGGKNEHR